MTQLKWPLQFFDGRKFSQRERFVYGENSTFFGVFRFDSEPKKTFSLTLSRMGSNLLELLGPDIRPRPLPDEPIVRTYPCEWIEWNKALHRVETLYQIPFFLAWVVELNINARHNSYFVANLTKKWWSSLVSSALLSSWACNSDILK